MFWWRGGITSSPPTYPYNQAFIEPVKEFGTLDYIYSNILYVQNDSWFCGGFGYVTYNNSSVQYPLSKMYINGTTLTWYTYSDDLTSSSWTARDLDEKQYNKTNYTYMYVALG